MSFFVQYSRDIAEGMVSLVFGAALAVATFPKRPNVKAQDADLLASRLEVLALQTIIADHEQAAANWALAVESLKDTDGLNQKTIASLHTTIAKLEATIARQERMLEIRARRIAEFTSGDSAVLAALLAVRQPNPNFELILAELLGNYFPERAVTVASQPATPEPAQ